MSLSSLSIFPATPKQIDTSRRRTSKEWGCGMTEDEYVRRDALADLSEVSRDGRLTTWVLAPRDTPTTPDFLCSCETFRRAAFLISPEGVPVNGIAYAIASVFTPPHNRSKGYARHMMRLLHWVLAPPSAHTFPAEWGAPPAVPRDFGNAAFSTLWSDVGREFYRACGPVPGEDGWVVRSPVATVWDVKDYIASAFAKEESARQWSWLDADAVLDLWETDTQQFKADLCASPAPNTRFTFLPNNGVAEFQHRRLQFFWEQLDPCPRSWGIYSSPLGTESDRPLSDNASFATWTIDPRPPNPSTLTITRLRASLSTFPDLLTQIVAYAAEHGVAKVEVWNIPQELEDFAVLTGGPTGEREDHLSAVKWYGTGDAQWVGNEKFCWC